MRTDSMDIPLGPLCDAFVIAITIALIFTTIVYQVAKAVIAYNARREAAAELLRKKLEEEE